MLLGRAGATAVLVIVSLQEFGQHVLKMKVGRALTCQLFPPFRHLKHVFPYLNGLGIGGALTAGTRLFCVFF